MPPNDDFNRAAIGANAVSAADLLAQAQEEFDRVKAQPAPQIDIPQTGELSNAQLLGLAISQALPVALGGAFGGTEGAFRGLQAGGQGTATALENVFQQQERRRKEALLEQAGLDQLSVEQVQAAGKRVKDLQDLSARQQESRALQEDRQSFQEQQGALNRAAQISASERQGLKLSEGQSRRVSAGVEFIKLADQIEEDVKALPSKTAVGLLLKGNFKPGSKEQLLKTTLTQAANQLARAENPGEAVTEGNTKQALELIVPSSMAGPDALIANLRVLKRNALLSAIARGEAVEQLQTNPRDFIEQQRSLNSAPSVRIDSTKLGAPNSRSAFEQLEVGQQFELVDKAGKLRKLRKTGPGTGDIEEVE